MSRKGPTLAFDLAKQEHRFKRHRKTSGKIVADSAQTQAQLEVSSVVQMTI